MKVVLSGIFDKEIEGSISNGIQGAMQSLQVQNIVQEERMCKVCKSVILRSSPWNVFVDHV